ncbi:MAG: hypothetical protein ACO2ON_01545 [Candidatus Nanopusillus sp.]
MDYLIQQLKGIVLGHLLEFQISYAKAKLLATNNDLLDLKFKLLVLLGDCYFIIKLYEESEDKKKEILSRIKDIENTVIELGLISDSLKEMEDIYDEIIKVLDIYLFSKETKEV